MDGITLNPDRWEQIGERAWARRPRVLTECIRCGRPYDAATFRALTWDRVLDIPDGIEPAHLEIRTCKCGCDVSVWRDSQGAYHADN